MLNFVILREFSVDIFVLASQVNHIATAGDTTIFLKITFCYRIFLHLKVFWVCSSCVEQLFMKSTNRRATEIIQWIKNPGRVLIQKVSANRRLGKHAGGSFFPCSHRSSRSHDWLWSEYQISQNFGPTLISILINCKKKWQKGLR